MKKIIFVLLLLIIPSVCHAQWNFFPDNILFRNDGTDLDGTGKILDLRSNLSVTYDSTTSTYHLAATGGGGELSDLSDINSSTQGVGRLLVSNGYSFNSINLPLHVSDDSIGIGTSNPQATLDVNGTIMLSNTTSKIIFEGSTLDDNETELGAEDPSQDITIEIPDINANFIAVTDFGKGNLPDADFFATWTADGKLSQVQNFSNGDLFGPATWSDEAIVRADGLNSKTVQGGCITIDDNGDMDLTTSCASGDISATIGTFEQVEITGTNNSYWSTIGLDPILIANYNANSLTLFGRLNFSGAGGFDLEGSYDVNSSTQTAGNLLVSNGLSFNSVSMDGDCTIDDTGTVACGAAATQLSSLTDVNSSTQTAGNILISNGVGFNSVEYYTEKWFSFENPTGSDDNTPVGFPHNCIDIKHIACIVDGGDGLELQLSDGTNHMDTIVCKNYLTKDDGSIANSTITADERLEFNVGTTGGTNTWLNFCITYQECF